MGNEAAWDAFERYIADARKRMEDKWAPVALICVQATTDADNESHLKLWDDAAMVWPATFPIKERGRLLKRMAKSYGDHTVLRG